MSEKPPRGEPFGCLFGLVGIILGAMVAQRSWSNYVAEILAEDPDAGICGLPWLAGMFWGVVLGGVIGTLLGTIVETLRLSSKRATTGASPEDTL